MPGSSDLEFDPGWRRLHDREWMCPTCSSLHHGIPDLACGKPEHWPGSEEKQPNSLAGTSSHFLSDDFCVLNGEHYFVRCVLNIPIRGSNETLGFGVWSTLSERNFQVYLDGFDSGDYESRGPWFGWFSNRLKGYPETLSLKCNVLPQNGRQRPLIELHAIDHLLVFEQREGISLDRLLEIHALNGHDFRRALVD